MCQSQWVCVVNQPESGANAGGAVHAVRWQEARRFGLELRWGLGARGLGFSLERSKTGRWLVTLGPPVPFYPFLGEGSPTKIDYRKKDTLILTSRLDDLAGVFHQQLGLKPLVQAL